MFEYIKDKKLLAVNKLIEAYKNLQSCLYGKFDNLRL